MNIGIDYEEIFYQNNENINYFNLILNILKYLFFIITSIYTIYMNNQYENYFNILDLRIILSSLLILLIGFLNCSVLSKIFNKIDFLQIFITIFLLIVEILNRIDIKNKNLEINKNKDIIELICKCIYYIILYINSLYFIILLILFVFVLIGIFIFFLLNYFGLINPIRIQNPADNNKIKKLFYSTYNQFYKYHLNKKEKKNLSKSYDILIEDKENNQLDYSNIKINKKKIDENIECPICMGRLNLNDIIIKFPHCNHFFHNYCLIKWLKINNKCPMCRLELKI